MRIDDDSCFPYPIYKKAARQRDASVWVNLSLHGGTFVDHLMIIFYIPGVCLYNVFS